MNREAVNAHRREMGFRRLAALLVFLMMVCGVITLTSLIRSVAPGWSSGLLAGVLLFIVLDRIYSHRSLRSLTPLSSEWWIALGSQWIVILVVVRLLLSYTGGLDALGRDLALIGRGFFGHLFSAEYFFSALLGMLVWYITGRFLGLLDEMGLDQELALNEETEQIAARSDVPPARQRLVSLTFSLGTFLVVMTGLARINLQTVVPSLNGESGLELNRLSGGESGALLYFVFGLALLSLGRLVSLQTRWLKQRIPISSGHLVRQWALYTLIFLLGLAFFTSLLPAGDSLGLFSLLASLLSFLFGILFFIGQLLMVLISMLFSLPLLLLRGEPMSSSPPPPPPLPTLLPVEASAPAAPNELWLLIRSVLLWGSLAAIILFAAFHFVRQHGGIRATIRKARITNWLMLAWQWLYRNAEQTRVTLIRVVGEGWHSMISRLEARGLRTRPEWINVRALDPRRQIYFFYLAMLRRSGEQGLGRQPSQTPAEYATHLKKAMPSSAEEIRAITDAFVEARYSRRNIDSQRARSVKETWGLIRRALQTKTRQDQAASKRQN